MKTGELLLRGNRSKELILDRTVRFRCQC